MSSRTDKKSKKKKNKWVKILLIIFGLLFLVVGVYAFTVYNSLTDAVDTMHQPIEKEKSDKRTEKVSISDKQPFSVLVLGVDERKGDKGRSDTMIVLTVNPNQNSMRMLSIPRDTRTEIIGKGFEDKINHAYAFGNEEMSMATVENLLDIPIDYFIKVNMEGFKDIVDAVGGIQVNNGLEFSNDGHHFSTGLINLNGEQALPFVRMRYDDPKGDFGRQDRQRQVIQGVIKRGASFSSLTKFDDIFAALGKNVRTNMAFDEMLDIQKNYKSAIGDLEQLQMSGNGTKIDGIYYLIVPEETLKSVQSELKTHLEIQ